MGKHKDQEVEASVAIHVRKLSVLWKGALVGLVSGLVVVAYRFALSFAEKESMRWQSWLKGNPWLLVPALLVLAGCGVAVGILVHRNPMIAGSGIPQVKGQMTGRLKVHWFRTVLGKFSGGVLALLAGLSLGREGPSIQLGASMAQGIAGKIGTSRMERRILLASGASAGLAAAFHAPLAGVMFALEEIFKYFSPVILLSTMISAVVADFVSGLFFGVSPVFHFVVDQALPLKHHAVLLVLGVLTGAAGACYNFTLLWMQSLYARMKWLPVWARPVVPFLMAGVLGLVLPTVTGSGHRMIELIQFDSPMKLLMMLLAMKFIFSMVSFTSGTPGGIFFPLLVMGATLGGVFSHLVIGVFGIDDSLFNNFVILAMVGLFTGIVRAPVTGVVLLVEMTGSFHQLLPLVIVAVISFATADLLRSQPIYDSLLENMLERYGRKVTTADKAHTKRILAEFVVHHGSHAENRYIRDLGLTGNCLLTTVVREGRDIIPKGNTRILAGDTLVVLCATVNESDVRQEMEEMTTVE